MTDVRGRGGPLGRRMLVCLVISDVCILCGGDSSIMTLSTNHPQEWRTVWELVTDGGGGVGWTPGARDVCVV